MTSQPSACAQRRPRRRTSMLALIALLALVPATGPATEAPTGVQPRELKVSVAVGHAFPLGKAAERWAERLTAAANGAFAAKLHPGATLADRDPAREFLALAEGRADLAIGSALQWSAQVPALAVFALPWLAPERRTLAALAEDASLRAALAKHMEAAGAVLVVLAPLGHRAIATTRRAVRGPADVAGLRVRIASQPLVQETLASLGAQAQAMPLPRAQAAFVAGTLDGQEGLPTALAAARSSVFGPRHLTDWGAFADAMVFAVRKPVWEGWTAAQREAAIASAAAAIGDADAPARETRAIGDADAPARETRAIGDLARSGVVVLRVTAAGHEAFRAAVRDVDARWREVVGRDVVEIAERAISAAAPGTASPRHP